ncbi:hypothetical protein C1X75_25470 [Pseudomonas sp. FW305-17]|nr:hypothetical protein C1X79_11145 [Pseudomonas sp. FW305-42]PNA27146.1 hypothetical protein C1X78_03185 [Pseudomonas sp. MPR-R1B]PNB26858.1 hypothetical protein C1X80_08550 [Pseudomonas sp. DP16D-E2]PNB40368.1 hypothetical protein C1X75_25470 [Pseudomonas sp. FW305-17]PNB59279.1 hypothetical protein C1X77_16290 [Pseudomonas sp. GW531-E2]PNB69729.1 hypothetical protein C1X76_04245 [Pseudomonas sp. FW305-127]
MGAREERKQVRDTQSSVGAASAAMQAPLYLAPALRVIAAEAAPTDGPVTASRSPPTSPGRP